VEEQTDKVFIKNVSVVLVILVLFSLSIAFVARDVGFKEDQDSNPSRNVTAEERIKSVADVYTDEDGAAAIEEVVTETAPAQAAAFDGSLNGAMIYANVCATCHATAVAGAPQPGSVAMTERANKGLDALMQTALKGLNAMPARGGRADLSDEQVQAAVEFMTQ